MKKSILTLTLFSFIAGTLLTGCETPAQKIENAENDLIEANRDLDEANSEYLAEVEAYRKKTADRIAENEKSIADFKARQENKKDEARAEYQKEIIALEEKNSDMKKKMDDYKIEGKEKWEKFKTEFSRDMDELGQAFKDLLVTNVD